ncbi:MAG: glycosyltransferase family 9 protein [Cyanobacteria bacterium SZAS TMP-1]|nr:glycosyltransferase family 9 protein [Cyanobacteria bacterium SZAS TMP-1]
MPPATPKNVLTINFGGIGDEILFLPALKQLRQALPQSKVTLLLEPRSKSVEQVTDLIDATIAFDIKKRPLLPKDLWQLLSLIRAGSYDLVISSGSSPQVAALLFLSGIPVRIGYGSNALARLLLTHPVALKREQYAGNMYHDLIAGLYGYLQLPFPPHQSQIPQVTVKEESRAAMQALLNETGTSGDTIVLLHPGTSTMAVQKGIIKTWPTEHWLALIEKLAAVPAADCDKNIRVILAGGPDDKEVIAALEAALDRREGGRPGNFVSFAGKTRGLSDLAALIDLSQVMVCVDSAPMHLAVGLHKKTVALFGPTEPEKLIPQSPDFAVLADRPEAGSSPPRSLLDGLGVRLQPDIVYRSVLDLLKAK